MTFSLVMNQEKREGKKEKETIIKDAIIDCLASYELETALVNR